MRDPKADLENQMKEIVAQSYISDDELNEATMEEIARIRKIMLEPDDEGKRLTEWRPQITFVSTKKPMENKRAAGIFLIANLPAEFEEKARLFEKAGDFAAEQKDIQCVAAFFSTEAWFTNPKPGEKYVQPSKSPDRSEGILANGVTIDGRCAGIVRKIVREGGNPDGRIIDLVDCGMDCLYKRGDNDRQIQSNLMAAFFRGYVIGRVKRGPFKDAFFNEDGTRKDEPGGPAGSPTGKWKKRF